MAARKKEAEIPKHAHCMMCGGVISSSETLCSDECRKQYKEMIRRQKYVQLTPFIPVVLLSILFAVLYFLSRR